MRRLISMVCLIGGLLCFHGASTALGVGKPISIMPLGDSITDDWNVAGSYRTKLYTELSASGFAVTFLGSQPVPPKVGSPTLINAGQTHHEGHSGYAINTLDFNLDSTGWGQGNNGGYWMTGGHETGRSAIAPDAVLLLAGGNDMYQQPTPALLQSRMTSLVNHLYSLNTNPNARVFVAQISPLQDDPNRVPLLPPGLNDNFVKPFNAWLASGFLSPTDNPTLSQIARDRTVIVNQYANFLDSNGNPIWAGSPGSSLNDAAHPTAAGYDKMGVTWANAIQATVPEPTSLSLLGLGGVAMLRRRRR